MTHPRLQAAAKKPPALTAQRFFGEICPAVFDARRQALQSLGGRYLFLVRGEGAWLLDFTDARVQPLADGADVDVDLAIELDQPAFTSLLKGTLDVRGAVAAERIAVIGDARLFPNLSAAFRPAA